MWDDGKRPLGRSRQRWKDNIEMNLREVEWMGVNRTGTGSRLSWNRYWTFVLDKRRRISWVLVRAITCLRRTLLYDIGFFFSEGLLLFVGVATREENLLEVYTVASLSVIVILWWRQGRKGFIADQGKASRKTETLSYKCLNHVYNISAYQIRCDLFLCYFKRYSFQVHRL